MSRSLPLDRTQTEIYLTFLLAPEQHDLREAVARSLQPAVITKDYQTYFVNKKLAVGLNLLRKGPKEVRAQEILGALERLVAREPAFVRRLFQLWLFLHADVIKALTSGTALPPQTNDEILHLAGRVINDERAITAALKATAAAAEQRWHDCEERLHTLEGEIGELRDQHLQTAQEWNHERQAWSAQQAADAQTLLAELQKNDAHWQSRMAHQEAEFRRALAAQEEAGAAARAAHEQALSNLAATQQAIVDNLQHRISEVRQEERTRHQDERRRAEQLEAQLRHLQHHRPELPENLPAALEGAIVINYFALHDNDPVIRITTLLGLYRALLDRDLDDERLRRASNASADNIGAPRGLVLVGLEQYLADAATLGVDRLLSLASVRRDMLLHQLVRQVDSPRLEGLV